MYSHILNNIENINNNIINCNVNSKISVKKFNYKTNNVILDLNDYIKTYTFDISRHLIIDDNGIIYNNNNNNTIVGIKSKDNNIKWL
jgi:hypothetical protein